MKPLNSKQGTLNGIPYSIGNYGSTIPISGANEDWTITEEILQDWLKDTKLVKEADLIDMVSKLILERLDQLLEGDLDNIVRLLIENKLFQDENTGLRKLIDEQNKKIEELSKRLEHLEDVTRWDTRNEVEPPAWGTTISTSTSNFQYNSANTVSKKSMKERLIGLFSNNTNNG